MLTDDEAKDGLGVTTDSDEQLVEYFDGSAQLVPCLQCSTWNSNGGFNWGTDL